MYWWALDSRLSRKALQSSLILAVFSAWVTFLMHFLATVGHKVSNYWKYGILRAAEEVVRAGVLSDAPGSESVNMFHLSHLSLIGQFLWFGVCLLGRVFFALVFLVCLIPDQSVRSSYQPMTSLAYIHDCHCCYDERSIDQKKRETASWLVFFRCLFCVCCFQGNRFPGICDSLLSFR